MGSTGGTLLLPYRRRGPLASLWIRVLIAVACLLITTAVVWYGRAGYRDLDGPLTNIWSCLYYATVSLSTTGYGDITPVTTWARMVNVLVITPLRFVFLITLVGTTVEVLTSRGRQEFRNHRWRERVRDHTVIVGFGVKGRTAVTTLLESGRNPMSIVVVAANAAECDEASALGLPIVNGDARREEVLRQARVETASDVVVAADRDDVTVLVTLTARQLNPTAHITVAARENANAQLLRQSGADSVIMTSESAGRIMAVTLLSPTAGSILEDLIDPVQGMEVVERAVRPDEVGLRPTRLTERGVLILSIIRNGVSHRFDHPDIDVLERSDRVVIIHDRNDGMG